MSQAVVRDPSLWCARRITVSLRAANGPPETIELARPFARVGSHPDCEIVLPSQEVPPLAAYLHATPVGGYGLKLANDAIEIHAAGRGRRRGLTVRIGRHTLDVRFAREQSSVAAEPVALSGDSARPTLWPRLEIEVPGNQRPVVRRLSRALTVVGRQPPSRLLLRHATVARTHSVLHWDGARLWVVNLLSPNGTRLVLPFARLGREWIDSGEVRLGDGLMLGDVRLRFIDVVEADVHPPVSREPGGPRAQRRRTAELAERCRQVEARCRRLARIAAEFRRQAKANDAARDGSPCTPAGPVADESFVPTANGASHDGASHDGAKAPGDELAEKELVTPAAAPNASASPPGDCAALTTSAPNVEPPLAKTGDGWSHERLIDSFVAEQRRVRRRRLLWAAAFVVPLFAAAAYVLSRPDVLERIEPLRDLWHEIIQAISAQ